MIGGVQITPAHGRVLAELASCPRGSGGVTAVMPGALLAALVQAGLARREPADALGSRFSVTPAGVAHLLSRKSSGVPGSHGVRV